MHEPFWTIDKPVREHYFLEWVDACIAKPFYHLLPTTPKSSLYNLTEAKTCLFLLTLNSGFDEIFPLDRKCANWIRFSQCGWRGLKSLAFCFEGVRLLPPSLHYETVSLQDSLLVGHGKRPIGAFYEIFLLGSLWASKSFENSYQRVTVVKIRNSPKSRAKLWNPYFFKIQPLRSSKLALVKS